MKCRRKNVSGVSPSDVTVYAVRCFAALGSASVFVIVVGNYFVAAFYEASGASACRIGFHIPVETSAPPKSAYTGHAVRDLFFNNQIPDFWQV